MPGPSSDLHAGAGRLPGRLERELMLARVQDAFGVEIYLGRVFEESTIRGLAAIVNTELLGDVGDEEMASLLAELEASER